MSDLISKKEALDALCDECPLVEPVCSHYPCRDYLKIEELPTTEPERLTDDDFKTIRIHLDAYKEKLCNQHRWEEAEKYQRIIDRFMAFAQPETLTDKEQRIFLAAMSREEKVCKEVDPNGDHLLVICREIKRKVKGALWA